MDRNTFDSQIHQLLTEASAEIPIDPLPDLPGLPSFPEVPQWHPHEHILWKIGEQMRQLMAESGNHLNDDHIDAVLQICRNPNAGRGRQSFVLLLGKVRYARFADAIVPLLQDPDVCGQAVNTLYKMKASGHTDAVRPLLDHEQTWIRKEARRYLQKNI